MKLKALSLEDCQRVRPWRNECLESLRTPFPLTEEMQEQFYRDLVCNRNARTRYLGIHMDHEGWVDEELIGMCGLENIELENRRAEISIILNPKYQGKGYGKQAVELLLKQGFAWMNLGSIWGECYLCNPAIDFWRSICRQYMANTATLPKTKYFDGKYYGSLHFTILKEAWLKCHK
jgi:RimJ/RimL family protein N-acetyltransferase